MRRVFVELEAVESRHRVGYLERGDSWSRNGEKSSDLNVLKLRTEDSSELRLLMETKSWNKISEIVCESFMKHRLLTLMNSFIRITIIIIVCLFDRTSEQSGNMCYLKHI